MSFVVTITLVYQDGSTRRTSLRNPGAGEAYQLGVAWAREAYVGGQIHGGTLKEGAVRPLSLFIYVDFQDRVFIYRWRPRGVGGETMPWLQEDERGYGED